MKLIVLLTALTSLDDENLWFAVQCGTVLAIKHGGDHVNFNGFAIIAKDLSLGAMTEETEKEGIR
jgi:hypothetical protein